MKTMPLDVTPMEIKQFLIETLGLEGTRPEDIKDDAPLFGEGLGLDSIDGLELHLAVAKRYQIQLMDDASGDRSHMESVNTLVAFLRR
jgi:acyl carrier protein